MTPIVHIMPNVDLAHTQPSGPQVAVLAYDGLCTFEFGVAYEVFGLPRPEMGDGWYRFQLARIEPGLLRAAGGLIVAADGDLSLLAQASLIIVPGWRGVDAPVPEPLIEALREAKVRGARIASLCSGVFVLAAAGLLDRQRATTHWRYVAALRQLYPDLLVEPDVLYVDNGQVLTAAGSAAAIDLCLHLVRRDFGVEAANRVARRLVVPPHRDGGQAQFIERPVAIDHESQRLGGLLDWMRSGITEPMPLDMLAKRAGLSLRTFQRRFEDMTGLAPGSWIIRERLRIARAMLETDSTILSLETIAEKSGFSSAALLRHHFSREFGVSPAAYRRSFAPSA